MRRLSIILSLAVMLGGVSTASAVVQRYTFQHMEPRPPSVRIPQFIVADTAAELPTVDVGEGDVAYAKDTDTLYTRTGSAWTAVGGGGGAPATATYLTQTPEAGLSAEQAMSLLGTGITINTTGTGVQSIYGGTSCTNQFPRSLDASGAATCATVATADLANNAVDNTKLRDSAGFSVIGNSVTAAGDPADIVAGADSVLGRQVSGDLLFNKIVGTQITNNAVTYNKFQDVTASPRFLGRITAGAGDPEELTGTQATTLLDNFTSTLKGLAPLSGGGTSNFLRADGTWAAPPSGGTPPTGTGFRHITAGVEDAAAKLVDTADVNNSQITYAKIQDVSAASKLLGRGSLSGAGPVQEIILGPGLTMATTFLSAGNFVEKSIVLTAAQPNPAPVTATGLTWVSATTLIVCGVLGTTADGLTPEAINAAKLGVTVENRGPTSFDIRVENWYGLEGTVRVHCTGV